MKWDDLPHPRILLLALVAFLTVATSMAYVQDRSMAQMGVSNPAAVPIPSNVLAPSETVAGQVGSSDVMFARADHNHPRITRATTCTLDSNGACSVVWSTALASAPTVFLTPVNPSASQPIQCNPTATPTTTGVSIKCWISQTTLLNLSIITAGLTLQPFAGAVSGTQVQIIAVPATQ